MSSVSQTLKHTFPINPKALKPLLEISIKAQNGRYNLRKARIRSVNRSLLLEVTDGYSFVSYRMADWPDDNSITMFVDSYSLSKALVGASEMTVDEGRVIVGRKQQKISVPAVYAAWPSVREDLFPPKPWHRSDHSYNPEFLERLYRIMKAHVDKRDKPQPLVLWTGGDVDDHKAAFVDLHPAPAFALIMPIAVPFDNRPEVPSWWRPDE